MPIPRSHGPIDSLHNAARAWCVDRIAAWHAAYGELNGTGRGRVRRGADYGYSDEAWAIFPRYNVLADILADVERYTPADFTSLDDLRDLLLTAAETADPAGLPPHVTLHTAALDDLPDFAGSLRAVLGARGIARVTELREWGDGLDIDLALADFSYTGAEGWWTADPREWMIYASHESSITFGGAWALEAARAILPRFDRFIYRGWDSRLYESP